MKAIWNETVVAESGHTVVVEGNHYFPPASIKTEYFRKSEAHTTCPWKGEASYCVVVRVRLPGSGRESLLLFRTFQEEPNENETSRTFNDDSGRGVVAVDRTHHQCVQ